MPHTGDMEDIAHHSACKTWQGSQPCQLLQADIITMPYGKDHRGTVITFYNISPASGVSSTWFQAETFHNFGLTKYHKSHRPWLQSETPSKQICRSSA